MKKLILVLGSALTMFLPAIAQAKDECPAEKQVYEFKPTGKKFSVGSPEAKRSKGIFLKIGNIDGEVKFDESDAIKSDRGIYVKIGAIHCESNINSEGYLGTAHCKK